MKKKKRKTKSGTENLNNTSKGDVVKQKLFGAYYTEIKEETEKFKNNNPNALDTNFYLFQSLSNKEKVRDMIFNLVYFYDMNFVGNKDFMHIPNIGNVLNNVTKYPIMLATKKDANGVEDILGTLTVKHEKNDDIDQNPYFPTVNEDVLSITGILTKLYQDESKRIKGIGRELFKTSIKAAYDLNKEKKVRLICEVDCRNVPSFSAVTKAVKELKSEGLDIDIFIAGYYEIKRSKWDLVEAPTLILEIDLNQKLAANSEKIDKISFNYLNCNLEDLYYDLSTYIRKKTTEVKKYINLVDDKKIIYHQIKPINAINASFMVGQTAEGNERVPSLNLQYVND